MLCLMRRFRNPCPCYLAGVPSVTTKDILLFGLYVLMLMLRVLMASDAAITWETFTL